MALTVRTERVDPAHAEAALDRLLMLREMVAEVIDLPTVDRTRAMLSQARDVLSDGSAAGDDVVDDSHRLLAEELNVLSWLTAGSREFTAAVAEFHHHLLAHLTLLRKLTP